jgi:TonB family protein
MAGSRLKTMKWFETASIIASSLSALVGDVQAWEASPASATPPKMISSPIKFGDYPQQALRNKQEGYVSVELKISVNGAPLSCEVTESAGHSALDEVTCKRLMKARFEPARDPDGVAVAGNFHTSVGWSMPSPGVVPDNRVFVPVAALPNGYVEATSTFLSFDAAGSLATCEIKASSGSKAFDETACALLRKQMKIAPPHALGNAPAAGYRYVPVAALRSSKR